MQDMEDTCIQKELLSGSLQRVKARFPTMEFPICTKQKKLERCRHMINFLLKQKKNYNMRPSNYSTLLHFAAMNRVNESFNLILEDSSINVNAFIPRTKTTLLHVVNMEGTYEMAKTLLERGANVNVVDAFNFTPLHYACSNVKINFSIGSMSTESSFDSSALIKDPKVVQLLLEYGSALEIETISQRETPLLLSCQSGYLEIFKLLLQHGADFYAVDRFGQNVLHKAVQSAHPGLIKIILDKGFDSNHKNSLGRSPIHEYYSSKGTPEVLDLLIKFGADINSRDYCENTPLHTACTRDFVNSVLYKYFLKRNPDINALNKSGETPLSVAVQMRDLSDDDLRVEVLENLCEHIAKLKAADKYICKENMFLVKNHPEIKEIYKKFEVELNKMKEEQVSSLSHFCYFYILKVSPRKLVAFVRNKKIMKKLASQKYKEMFPLYSNSLTESINVAISRRNFTATCASRLCKHIKRNLPPLIVDQVFSHLSEKDLKNFEEAFINVRQ
ncbi:ankyrin repeat, PH and SEC7 domain containing protein secG-like [Belonocnema kinseyi]|uniref:ankyrin repeat, PH and SEC7 domain containing protein secG-like n=1 Tax=Belonocnema kinseyi TaxID=2817044 RepID=UPI00143D2DBE|nr:ankyrin repeat, PH and SEC7 domain containing protein secG-like [Belonocnema kinseyi]